MREDSLKMINSLIRVCSDNMRNSPNYLERLQWENAKEGLEYIKEIEGDK